MNNEQCRRWELIDGIDMPCADISIAYVPPHMLAVSMHFSRVVGGPTQDLLLQFAETTALYWEEESFGLKELPDPLPRCSTPKWSTWTFPLLVVEHSTWLQTYEDHFNQHGAWQHFVLISMNDLVHILASPDVTATWVESSQVLNNP